MRFAAMEGQGFCQSLDAAVGAGPLFFSGLLTRTKDQHSGLEWLASSLPSPWFANIRCCFSGKEFLI